eukprot:gene3707-biopygen5279
MHPPAQQKLIPGQRTHEYTTLLLHYVPLRLSLRLHRGAVQHPVLLLILAASATRAGRHPCQPEKVRPSSPVQYPI